MSSLFHSTPVDADLLQSLDRCATLDDTLSRLARIYPATKFLRARAGAIGFATSRDTTSARSTHLSPFPITRRPSRQILVPGRYPRDDDDDDPYGDDDGDDSGGEEADDGWDDDNVDTDVLPTLLAYRGGALEHTWVRVDWEAKSGVEDLLRRCVQCCLMMCSERQELTMAMAMGSCRHGILHETDPRSGVARVNGSLSDDDDLDDGELVFGGSDDEV